MKFKKVLLGLMGVAMLALAACSNGGGNTSKEPTPTSQTPTPSTQQEEKLLDGVVSNGKIRIDIMNENIGVTFSYGNEAVVSKKEMTYSASSKLTVSGTATADLNFVIVIGRSNGYSVAVNAGIEKESIAEYLTLKDFENAARVYVAISTGDVNWTKGLNTNMDHQVSSFIVKK